MKKKNNDSLLFSHLISDFLYDYAPSFLTQSENSLKGYEDTLSLYIKYLEETGITKSTISRVQFEKDYIEKWILWMKNTRNCSPQTCNVRLGSFRTFLEYVGNKELKLFYLYQEAKCIKRQKTVKTKVSGLSRDVINCLLQTIDLRSKTGRRDYTFIMLLYGVAARINEVLSLKIQDLHLECSKPYINIFGKGAKKRTAYLLPRIVKNLQGYILEAHGKTPNPYDYVFFSKCGEERKKLSQTAITKRLKQYASDAHSQNNEVPLDLHSHQFRHAKATHLLQDGMNIVQIKFLLGHESVETTMKYLDISINDKENAIATLESEKEKSLPKEWKQDSGSLSCFLGLKR